MGRKTFKSQDDRISLNRYDVIYWKVKKNCWDIWYTFLFNLIYHQNQLNFFNSANNLKDQDDTGTGVSIQQNYTTLVMELSKKLGAGEITYDEYMEQTQDLAVILFSNYYLEKKEKTE